MHSIKYDVDGFTYTLDIVVREKAPPFDDPSATDSTDVMWESDRIAKLEIDPLAREHDRSIMHEARARCAAHGYVVVWATHARPDLQLVVMPGEIRTFFADDPECPADLAGQRKGGLYWRASAADAWAGPAVYGRVEAIQALQRNAAPRATPPDYTAGQGDPATWGSTPVVAAPGIGDCLDRGDDVKR